MGDRANIYVVDRPKAAPDDVETFGIYLYTHWNGSEWPQMLRAALDLPTARRCWRDEPYLLRIIADFLFKDLRDGETGGGIGTCIGDNEHPITVLDMASQTVSFAAPGTEMDRDNWQHTVSYEQFVSMKATAYPMDVASR